MSLRIGTTTSASRMPTWSPGGRKSSAGDVFAGPFDVLSAGRMAAILDPQGAMVIAWKPGGLVGAEVVNEPGAMTWNDLLTSDVKAAREVLHGPLWVEG